MTRIARRSLWGLMTLLGALVATYALANVSVPAVRSPFAAELLTEKTIRGVAHLGLGAIALVTGALQFSTRIRFESPRQHRRIGTVYLWTVLASGTAGLFLAPSSEGGVSAHFGFGILAVLWVSTAVMAVRHAKAGDYPAHRAWMIRSYALCLAAVTLRLYLPAFGIAGVPFESAYPAISWLCWVPNLVVAEWLVIPSSVAPLQPE